MTVESTAYQNFHTQLKARVLSLYRGQIPATIQTINLAVVAEVLVDGGKPVPVDGELNVTIEVVPPAN